MKGAVFLGAREVELREFPDPVPGDDEVVLEIKASGMCGSDLMVYRASPETVDTDDNGEYFIGGHEPCGVVVAKGANVTSPIAAEGSRVMPHHYLGCGVCSECNAGWSQLCPEGSIGYGWNAHGGHARYMKTAARTLVPLPESLSFAAGAAISCGTGTAYAALKRIGLAEGQTLAVFGQGPVGLSATLFGADMGARVIAVDVEPKRLELARGFGADETLDATGDDTVEAIKTLTAGHGGGHVDRLQRLVPGTASSGSLYPHLGHHLFCRRGQRRDLGCQRRSDPKTDDHYRFVDFLRRWSGGVRSVHCRQRHQCRCAIYRPVHLGPGRLTLTGCSTPRPPGRVCFSLISRPMTFMPCFPISGRMTCPNISLHRE